MCYYVFNIKCVDTQNDDNISYIIKESYVRTICYTFFMRILTNDLLIISGLFVFRIYIFFMNKKFRFVQSTYDLKFTLH